MEHGFHQDIIRLGRKDIGINFITQQFQVDKSEALRAIHLDQLDYIQQKVAVDFDNRRQKQLSLSFRGRTYAVEDVVCRCRTDLERATSGYLVRLGGQEVYYLYMQAGSARPAQERWGRPCGCSLFAFTTVMN